jgi:hypothetical protein
MHGATIKIKRVRRSSFQYLAMTLTQPYMEIHNTIYRVQSAFHILTYRTSANGKGKVHPITSHEGLEGE